MRARILHLTHSRGWSGGGAQMLLLADRLRDTGHQVYLLCPEDGEIARKARQQGWRVHPFQARNDGDLLAALALVRFVRRHRIDLVHAHHARAHAVALWAKWLYPHFRLVITRRVSFPIAAHPFSRLKYAAGALDAVIAVSEAIRQELLRAGVDPEKLHVVASGVDPARFFPRSKDPALLSLWGLPAQGPWIGKVANYSVWKGQHIFLQAARLLLEKGISVHFLLVGRDTQHPELLRQVRELGLESSVHLLGFQEAVPELLSLLDISVNSAVAGEGLSGSLRESLCMEIPVIATDVGGNRELVCDRRTGRLVPPQDPQALAQAMWELLRDPEGAAAMGRAGRKLVLERYEIGKTTEQILRLYQSLWTPRKILLLQLRRIGDAVLTLPALARLQEEFPRAQVDLLLESPAATLMPPAAAGSSPRILHYRASEALRWIRRIREEKYDWVLDFLNTPRTALLSATSGARVRAGSEKNRYKFFYDRLFPRLSQPIYGAYEKLRGLEVFGIAFQPRLPALSLSPQAQAGADVFFRLHPMVARWLAFLPHSRHPSRRWPLERYAALGRRLLETSGAGTLGILILGSLGERCRSVELASAIGEGAWVAPRTPALQDLAALLARCALAVTNCNGPKHIAAGVGVPTLTLHGSSDPRAWNPPHAFPHPVLLAEGLWCLGCKKNICPYDLECMEWLSCDLVFEEATEMLNSLRRAAGALPSAQSATLD
ncbi:MAG: glycosyltransferase [Elusimicrobia bacterium]|nr:glycosyltransferase [Elusimicrobiota bacterium]